jgi:hypothetical protein
MSDTTGAKNTDRELWRGPDQGTGSYYADSIHVTEGGGIGINCGGYVFVRPLRDWHAMPARIEALEKALRLAIEELGWGEMEQARKRLRAAIAPEQDK